MKKLLDKLVYFEIAMLIFIVIAMFFPVLHLSAGMTNENFNAWHAIFGIKASTGSSNVSVFKFSFLALLPYILLLICFLLIAFYDGKNNLCVDIFKTIIFIGCGFLFIFYLYLLRENSSLYSDLDEALRLTSDRFGHYVSAVFSFIAGCFALTEVVNDIKINKTK